MAHVIELEPSDPNTVFGLHSLGTSYIHSWPLWKAMSWYYLNTFIGMDQATVLAKTKKFKYYSLYWSSEHRMYGAKMPMVQSKQHQYIHGIL